MSEETNELVKALGFISLIQEKENSNPMLMHCQFTGTEITAFNGTIAIGYPYITDLIECPHTLNLLHAVKGAKGPFSITKDGARLTLASGRFRAYVPCLPALDLTTARPDRPCARIDDRFREALRDVLPVVSETGSRILEISILMNGSTLVTCNGHIVLERFHGIDLPAGLVLPRILGIVLNKIKIPLKEFGFSERTVTLWFENGAWLRTQLYDYKYPNIGTTIFGETAKYTEIPENFTEAIEALEPFSDGRLYMCGQSISSHRDNGLGANYDLVGIPDKHYIRLENIKLVKDWATHVDFSRPDKGLFFKGENIRGAIIAMRT